MNYNYFQLLLCDVDLQAKNRLKNENNYNL